VVEAALTRIPEVTEPTDFADVILREGVRILFDADTPPSPPTSQHPNIPTTLLIGPEGGWSDDELRAARAEACRFERLGPRRLRAETAAIVACAIIAARSAGF